MPFHKGHFYMHSSALDVALEVLKVRHIGHESVTLIVNIINLGYVGDPTVIMTDRNYSVHQREYGNYHKVYMTDLYKARTKPGRPE